MISLKSIVIGCVACLLAACSTPAPETAVPAPASTPSPAATPTPLPTATPTFTPEPTATPVPRRAIVLARGKVTCGIEPGRPNYVAGGPNFDADMCRAIAAALFDNPDAVDVRPLDVTAASTALASGDLDVYVGPINQSLPGLQAGPALFIDAAGAVARSDVGIRTLADLKFATVCLIQDSIEERLFSEAAAAERVKYQPFRFNAEDLDAMYRTYDQGRCDVVVDNRIRLAQRLTTLSDPRNQGLIDLVLPIGPRGLITAADDANWSGIAAAIGGSLIRAEELGVDSTNVEDALAGDDAATRQLLGAEADRGLALGLGNDFVVRLIRHVGNYGEIYDRHFPDLPRGPNALAKNGGWIGKAP